MDRYLDILKNEFEAGETSFLIKIRSNLEWDKNAFSQLVSAMKMCCEHQNKSEMVERWLAQGFWYLPNFVSEWTTHKNFPRPHSEEYYEKAYERLDDLAFWFFFGESPSLDGHGFEPL